MAPSSLLTKQFTDSFRRVEEFFSTDVGLQPTNIPPGLDLHYITDQILCVASSSFIDKTGQQQQKPSSSSSSLCDGKNLMGDDSDSDSMSHTTQKSHSSLYGNGVGPLHLRRDLSAGLASLASTRSSPPSPIQSGRRGRDSLDTSLLSSQQQQQQITASVHLKKQASDQSMDKLLLQRRKQKHRPIQSNREQLFSYLSRHHPSNYILLNLSGIASSSEMIHLFPKGRVIDLPWICPGLKADTNTSSTSISATIPTLSCLLNICYAMDSYLQLHPKHTLVLCCSNGISRSSIAIAAYLRYTKQVLTTFEGYQRFWSKRFSTTSSSTGQNLEQRTNSTTKEATITPLLQTLFQNFDSLLDFGCNVRQEPMILRAITLQGIPVESLPRLDLWDTQGCIFSSHKPSKYHMDVSLPQQSQQSHTVNQNDSTPCLDEEKERKGDPKDEDISMPLERIIISKEQQDANPWNISTRRRSILSESSSMMVIDELDHHMLERDIRMEKINKHIWADEEGFYRVNATIQGDFFLLCRFGLPHTEDEVQDPSMTLFRYANSTAFMFPGPWNLPKSKVDIMQIYADSFDSQEFAVTLVFDPMDEPIEYDQDLDSCYPSFHGNKTYEKKCFKVLHGFDALLKGVELLRGYHNRHRTHLNPLSNTTSHHYDGKDDHEQSYRRLSDCFIPSSLDFDDAIAWLSLIVNRDNMDEAKRKFSRFMKIDPSFGNKCTIKSSSVNTSFQNDGDELWREMDSCSEELLDLIRDIQLDIDVQNKCPYVSYIHEPIGLLPIGISPSHAVLYRPNIVARKGDIVRAFMPDYDDYDQNELSMRKMSSNDWHNTISPPIPSHRKSFPMNEENTSLVWNHLSTRSVSSAKAVGGSWESLGEIKVDHPTASNNVIPQTITVKQGKNDEIKDSLKNNAFHRGKEDFLSNRFSDRSSPTNFKAVYTKEGGVKSNEPETKRTSGPHYGALHKGSGNHHQNAVVHDSTRDNNMNKADKVINEYEAGTPIPIVVNGTNSTSGKIIGRNSGYYTVQIPVHMLSDGKIVIAEKSEAAAAADAAALVNTLNRDGNSFIPVSSYTKKPKGRYLNGHMAATAAAIIAQSKISKAETRDEVRPALKEDPEYSKYFRMLKMGLSREAVRHALKKDGKDPDVMEQDHSLPAPILFPLREEPEYKTYFTMIADGNDKGEIKQRMAADGKNPMILDLDPDVPLSLQFARASSSDEPGDLPLMDDPMYAKYFKMVKLGMAKEIAKHALARDGKDPRIIDLDPEKPISTQSLNENEHKDALGNSVGFSLKEFRKRRVVIPSTFADPKGEDDIRVGLFKAIRKRSHIKENIDPETESLGEERHAPPLSVTHNEDVRLRDSPEYAKYFKMMKMGLPKDAVKNALRRDGKDPAIADLDPEKSLTNQQSGQDKKDTTTSGEVALKDSPEYAKYFKMMEMGLPKDAVKNALRRDGKDPAIADLDPEKPYTPAVNVEKSDDPVEVAKAPVRRKKIYWNTVDHSKIAPGSMWEKVVGMVDMRTLKYDSAEFENLFTEPLNNKGATKSTIDSAQAVSTGKTSKPKKEVKVIDSKRGFNGDITLARIKMSYEDLANVIDRM